MGEETVKFMWLTIAVKLEQNIKELLSCNLWSFCYNEPTCEHTSSTANNNVWSKAAATRTHLWQQCNAQFEVDAFEVADRF